MKNKIIIFLTVVGTSLMLNSCFLFGGGKSKCGDCPTWSQQDVEEEEIVERERV